MHSNGDFPQFLLNLIFSSLARTQNLDMLVGAAGNKIRLFVDILELPLAIMEMHSFEWEVGKGA